jgi:hypothetical protein
VEIAASSTIGELKEEIKRVLSLEAQDLKLEKTSPGERFGDDVVDGTLESNKIANGDKITVVSIDVKYGVNVSNAAPIPGDVLSDGGGGMGNVSGDAPGYRTHDPGANYEANCPTVKDRSVIVPRGFGIFEWATDPVDRYCPCCKTKIPVANFTRIAVSNTIWSYEGIGADGTKKESKGSIGHEVQWIVQDPNKTFRKLILIIRDPNNPNALFNAGKKPQEAPKPTVPMFHCALCRKDLPRTQHSLLLGGKDFCGPCAENIRERQRAREIVAWKAREAAEEEKRKNAWRKDAVALPGLGATIALKNTAESQAEREKKAQLAALQELEDEQANAGK